MELPPPLEAPGELPVSPGSPRPSSPRAATMFDGLVAVDDACDDGSAYAVGEGETVEAGQPLAIVEAMKMQNILRAEHKVVVDKLLSDVGDVVAADQMLIAFVQDDE